MAITLNPGHKYTFAYIDSDPSIVASSDNVTDTYFRSDIEITGSVTLDANSNINLTGGSSKLISENNDDPIRLINDSDIYVQLQSTNLGATATQRWSMGIDSTHPVHNSNTFFINQGIGSSTDADFRVSGSTIILDYDDMPTSVDHASSALPKGTVYRDASNYLRIAP